MPRKGKEDRKTAKDLCRTDPSFFLSETFSAIRVWRYDTP
jgi:hypothetical protein